MSELRTRREVMAGVALGSGVLAAAFAPTAVAGSHDDLASPENDLGQARRRWLARRAEVLNGENPSSRVGLVRLLDALRGEDVLSGGDRNLVEGLIDVLFASADRDAFGMWFDTKYSELADSATAIGRRMVEFVKGHVDALVNETNWGRRETTGAGGARAHARCCSGCAGDWGGWGGAARRDRCGDSSFAGR